MRTSLDNISALLNYLKAPISVKIPSETTTKEHETNTSTLL